MFPIFQKKEVVVPVEYAYFNGIKNIKIMKLLMTPMQVILGSVSLYQKNDDNDNDSMGTRTVGHLVFLDDIFLISGVPKNHAFVP